MGQPHLHLIVSGLGNEYASIAAGWSHLWLKATRDSYIVDVRPVWSSRGAARYLVKYLIKGMGQRMALESLGFVRRWSRSRGWPADRVRLRGTVEDGWRDVSWVPGRPAAADGGWVPFPNARDVYTSEYQQVVERVEKRGRKDREMELVGGSVAVRLHKRQVREAVVGRIRALASAGELVERELVHV